MSLLGKLLHLPKTTNAAVIIAVTFIGFIAFMGFVFVDHNRQVNQLSEVVQQNLQSSKKMLPRTCCTIEYQIYNNKLAIINRIISVWHISTSALTCNLENNP